MFKLSTTLSGHELDVRDIVAPSDHTIVSASRDSTVRIWNPTGTNGWSGSTLAEPLIAFHSPSNCFINSVEYVNNPDEPLIASGGQDAMIYLSDLAVSDLKGDDVGKYQLIGHQANVCSLHYKDREIISGSWDTTAKVWDLDTLQIKYDLVGHQSSVWDAKIIGPDTYLTCSADRTIRLWQGKQEIGQFTGHSDVVRKLLILPNNQFASVSNDGTIKIWDLKGNTLNTLVGHDSFVYDVKRLSNGDLVSTGEDRTVRIWRDNKILQVITLPCISVWCAAIFENDDIAVGGSDNTIRVFSRESARQAPEEELIQFKESIEGSTIAEQSIDDLKKTDIPGYEALQHPGKQEGAVLMVKSLAGVIEAHQWSGGEWIKIGDVVGSSGSTSKKEFDGQEWDFVFDVDIEDGAPPLKLPYNSNENPYAAAERFLSKNELPSSYVDEVVKFINKNTEGFQLEQGTPAQNPYADKREAPSTTTAAAESPANLKVIPEKTYIQFKDFKYELLSKGVAKFNESQATGKFTPEQLAKINYNLSVLNSKEAFQLIVEFVPQIVNNWTIETRLVGYDLLRVSIPRVTAVDLLKSTEIAEIVLKVINDGIDNVTESTLPLLMLLFKTINNLFDNVLFVQLFIDPTDDGKYEYNEYFQALLAKIATTVNAFRPQARLNKHYGTTLTTLASLVYNLSAYQLKTKLLTTSEPVVTFSDLVGQHVVESSSEAGYRIGVAYGNLRFAGQKFANVPPNWINSAKALYGGSEQRYRDLEGDLLQLA